MLLGVLCVVGLYYLIPYLQKKEKEKEKDEDPRTAAAFRAETAVYKLPPVGGWFSEMLSRKGFFKIGRLSVDFLNSLSFLRENLRSSHYKYIKPWVLVLGAENSGKTTLLKTLHALDADWQTRRKDRYDTECNWVFLQGGVVLDVKGKLFLEKEKIGSDEVGWNALRNLLIRYRSGKPIDSLLLNISMEDLYGKERIPSLQCLERAKFMAQKISLFQEQVGLRLPIYIVLTKTDIVPGFQEFCQHIPLGTKKNMVGWASPYTPDTVFSHKWVKEALAAVSEQIRHINMDTFCEDLTAQTQDSLFVFPYELEKIYDNLLIYVNQIFKDDPYKAAPLLRGIYFTGDSQRTFVETSQLEFLDPHLLPQSAEKNSEDKDAAAEAATPPAQSDSPDEIKSDENLYKRLFFFGDLMDSKILPEYALSRPQKGRLSSANKSLKGAKIATAVVGVVGFWGLYSSYYSLKETKTKLMPTVESMYRFLVQTQNIPLKELAKRNEAFESAVRQLSTVMQNLYETSLFSVFIPASWFSPLKSRLNQSVNLAYQNVIMRALYVNLLLKARDLLHRKPEDITPTDSISQLALPTKSHEFKAMKKFVMGLSELSTYVEKFNDLRVVASPKVLAELVDYAFKMTLSESFLKYYGRLKGKLSTSTFPAIDLTVCKNLARQTFSVLFQHFFSTLFLRTNPKSFPAQLERLIRQLQHVDARGLSNLNALRKLSKDLEALLKVFEPEANENIPETKPTWMDKDVFEPDQDFEDFLCSIDASPFFGPDTSQEIVDNCAIGLAYLKPVLKELTQLLTTDVRFAAPEDAVDTTRPCSTGLILLAKALKTLFNEAYMRRATNHQFINAVPEGQAVFWDDKLLKAACELCTQYEEFATKKVGGFPVVIQESFRLLARDGLQRNIISLIAQSQNFVALPINAQNRAAVEEGIRSQTANMRLVHPLFLKLLELLNYESVSFFYITLRDFLLTTNYHLLERINQLMKQVGPYHVWDPSFSWWDGKTNPAYVAYSVKDAQDLNSFLNIQGQHVVNLALTLAKPVVDLLSSDIMLSVNPPNRALLTKWKRIVEQTELYQAKQPGSSLAVLENFVTTTLQGYSLDNVFETIPLMEVRSEVGDHFLETVQLIKRGILGQAEVLTRQKNMKKYQELATFFNKSLRGRFPFTPPSTDPSQGMEADPEDVRLFLTKFQQMGGCFEKILDQIYQLGNVASGAVEFLQKIEQVYALFQNYLETDPGGLPSIVINSDFNVNRDRAVGSNLIAQWSLKTNFESSVGHMDKNRQALWLYGCPTEVTFRWPNIPNMKQKPLNDLKQPSLKVVESTATFTYTGQWSLFRMVRRHRANRGEYLPMVSPNVVVLKYVIPVSETESAVLFNSVAFLGPSSNPNLAGKTIVFPDFPVLAPELSPDLEALKNQPVLSFGIVAPTSSSQIRKQETGGRKEY
ncbi:hypothetical protein AGMMS50296_1750 [Alphaproteobacteria bacterium]|nr:hypothetical protein AGMMS50296_1750 [Alphaproteobacteria bacterium]